MDTKEADSVNLRVRDFYKRSSYKGVPQYLVGMLMCTFVLLPWVALVKLIDKIY